MIGRVIKNRAIIFFLLFCLIVGGIYSYIILPKQEAPDLTTPLVLIKTFYPGASIEDVDEFVTKKIEEKLSLMENIDYMQSYSHNSSSYIFIYFKYGVDSDEEFAQVRRLLDDIDFPEGVLPYELNTDLTKTAGILISLSSDELDYNSLEMYADKVSEGLKKINGISNVEKNGVIEKEVVIDIDYKELNRLNLSFNDIIRLIKSHNIEIPSGEVEVGDQKIPIKIAGSLKKIEDIENIIINVSEDNYTALKIKDIAKVSLEDEENSTIYTQNGDKAILLSAYFEDNKNILLIGDEIRAEIENQKENLPDNINFHEVVFQPDEISSELNSFIINLFIGIILVIIVVFIAMGIRNAVIVSLAIPTSILATIAAMPSLGIKIHTVTITAFIVALGMLVDNAIVVSDSIQIKLDEGTEKLTACIEGTKEVVIPILTSTLTTLAAFLPLILVNSLAGDYVKALPQVVMLSLSASFLFSFLVTPSLAYVFFKAHNKERTPKTTFMETVLSLSMKKKGIAIAGFIVSVALTASLIFFVNVIFFPKADKDLIYIDITADKNIGIDYTKEVTDQVEDLIKEEPGIKAYTTAVGGGLPKYYTTLGILASIPENAQMVLNIDLSETKFSKNTGLANYLQRKIDENLKNGKAKVNELEIAEPFVSPILLRVLGEEGRIKEVAAELKEKLIETKGTKNVKMSGDPKSYEYEIELDNNKLSYYGITKYDVLNEVSISLFGREASILKKDGKELSIKVRGTTKDIEDVKNLMIKSSINQKKYLLEDISEVKLSATEKAIRKYNGVEEIILTAELEQGYGSRAVESAFIDNIADVNTTKVELMFDGVNQKISFYFGDLGMSAILAVFLIFIILLIQFRNFKNALIIFVTLPLSTAGAIFGLFVFNQPLSFTALVGVISLIGIVVNNAIVLVEFMEAKRTEGIGVEEVAKRASLVRFRPIMLSTITTCTGLLPLVFSSSELFKPMSVALVFGLLVSTFLTLVFVPLLYSRFHLKEETQL